MSLHLEFEPHSWYKDFAIKDCRTDAKTDSMYSEKLGAARPAWEAYTANGMTGYIDTVEADTLKELRQEINDYYKRKENPLYKRG